jgi:hypothetical protein
MLMVGDKPKKSNKGIGALVIVLTIGIVVAVTASVSFPAATVTTPTTFIQSAEAWSDPDVPRSPPKAPAVISGENVYIVWWTDRGTVNANGEVMFRASNDGGETFSDKINLSNTTTVDSVDAEIAAEGANVIVTWWERNQTSDIPVARISEDAGETFGPMLRLGTNGTISGTEEEGGQETVEEAVEEAAAGE